MQPYFLPYFEQFRLMADCDLWVVFDTVQYTRKSWMNRNRVLNRDKGWGYITVPVQHTGLGTPVHQAWIDDRQDWRQRLMDRLKVYQHQAPHYARTRDWLAGQLQTEVRSLSALNTALLLAVHAELGITTPVCLASELPLVWPATCDPGEWALLIARHLGATAYRNASGGAALFDPALYARHGIDLSFHVHRPCRYPTGRLEFVPGLSIIDWLMWNEREQLQAWLAPVATQP